MSVHGQPMADPGNNEQPPLNRKTVSGVVGWGVALALVQKLGAITVSLVLVRLISAEAFGQYGLVNALLMFAFTLSMQRFMEHSFHSRTQSESGYAEHLGFGILLHIGLFVVLNLILLLAPLPSNYGAVRTFAHVASLSILLNIPRIFYSVHLRRVLDWRRQRFIHLTSFALSAVGSISLAAAGYGVWALIAQNLLIPLPYIFDLLRQRPDLLRACFNLSGYVPVLQFGSIRLLSGAVGVGQQLAEASLFTATAGFASFGIYGRAAGIAALASSWIGDQLTGLLYPIISRVDPGSVQARHAAGLVLRLAMWTSAPLAASFFVFNDTVVSVLYGAAWADVAPLLQPALVVAALATTLRGLMLVLLTMVGPGASLIAEVAQLGLCLAGLTFVLSDGMLAYVWFLAAGGAVLVVATLTYLTARGALSLSDVAAAVAPMIVLALSAAIAASSEQVQVLDAQHSLAGLVVAVAAGGLLALAVVRVADSAGLASACHYLPSGAKVAQLLRLAPSRIPRNTL